MVFVGEESMELYLSKLASTAAKVFNCIAIYLDIVFFFILHLLLLENMT